MRRHCCSGCTASLCAACISLTIGSLTSQFSLAAFLPWYHVAAISFLRCTRPSTAFQVRGRTHGGLFSACHCAPVLPLQEQQMTGTTATLRLLTLRRLAPYPLARSGCLLIAAAENTYYSRVSSKRMASSRHVLDNVRSI